MERDPYDLAYVMFYASCIWDNQKMTLADGGYMSAGEIFSRVKEGKRIDFRTPDLERRGECANPVIGCVRTRAKGVRITFQDGRSVVLTTGHVLPVDREQKRFPQRKDDWYGNMPIYEQRVVRAGQVKAGMHLLDGVIHSVERVGKINAVRIWTADPAWLKTAEGLSIGSRWHEVMAAWVTCIDDPEKVDFWGDPAPMPISATGWYGAYYNKKLVEEFATERGERVSTRALAGSIEPYLINRWDEPFNYSSIAKMPKRAMAKGGEFKSEFLRPKLRLLKGGKAKKVDQLLVAGNEVVGEPVLVDEPLVAVAM